MQKPYFWKRRRAWFVKSEDNKSQIKLHEDEATAYTIWQEMQAVGSPQSPNVTMMVIAETFLDWAEKNVTKKTYRGYADLLDSFCGHSGNVTVRELKPYHLTRWLDAKSSTWKSPDSVRAAIGAVKRCLNWARAEGLIKVNPLESVKKPKGKRRNQLITEDQHAAMVRALDRGRTIKRKGRSILLAAGVRDRVFKQFLIALKHSGTRPGMVAKVTTADVSDDCTTWQIAEHKTVKHTGKPLTVYLSPCLQTLTQIAINGRDRSSDEPLFRNSLGKPWTENAIRCRVKNLREWLKLPAGVVAYSYRHTWTTEAIVSGVDLATVAEMLGHTDLKMLSKHYAHLDKKTDHLKDAAAKVARKRMEG